MIQGAQGWCTGMTQRDRMRREVGGGFRMGNTCTPMADSCQCMAKPIQYCKVISLQKKKRKKITRPVSLWLVGLAAKSCPTIATPWTVACQASLSMGFSRQEYWHGLPFPSPGYLTDPGIKPISFKSPALQADSLPLSHLGNPRNTLRSILWALKLG